MDRHVSTVFHYVPPVFSQIKFMFEQVVDNAHAGEFGTMKFSEIALS